jgi:hypothetical protein
MMQNKSASDHAICVAAIEIGADSAISKRLPCKARSIFSLNDEFIFTAKLSS